MAKQQQKKTTLGDLFPNSGTAVKNRQDQEDEKAVQGPGSILTIPGLTKENILALDIATMTGFATITASGVWNLTPKKDESKGMRLINLRGKLAAMLGKMPVKLIVFEYAVTFGKHPNMIAPEMIGVMKAFCEDNGIDYKGYAPTTLKVFATGNHNATKEMMVTAARARWGMQGDDNNEADALAALHFSLEDLGIVQPSSPYKMAPPPKKPKAVKAKRGKIKPTPFLPATEPII